MCFSHYLLLYLYPYFHTFSVLNKNAADTKINFVVINFFLLLYLGCGLEASSPCGRKELAAFTKIDRAILDLYLVHSIMSYYT